MKRFTLLAVVLATAMTVAGPAAANHDNDQNGLAPIVPWQHHGETFDVIEGESLDIGARWGACTRGLAHSFTKSALVGIDVDVVEGADPQVGAASWSEPVNPPLPVILPDVGELCGPEANGDTGWWVFWVSTVTFDTEGVYEVTVQMVVDRIVQDGVAALPPFDLTATINVVVSEP